MAYLSTAEALHDIGLGALVGLVSHLVTLEAQLGIAVERVVRVLSAEDAVGPAALIRALLRHVAKLLTVATLYRRVRLRVVPSLLVLQPIEHVIFTGLALFFAPACAG